MSTAWNIYTPFQRIFRPKRLRAFYSLFQISAQTRVLDIGGGAFFWDLALAEGFQLPQITVLNVRPPGEEQRSYLKWVVGNACTTLLPDNSYDLVFSNSLVEHLGDWNSQQRFANEVRRLAPRYFVQTPDRFCPIEPHFVTPFVHWLPKDLRRRMIRNLTVWGLTARPSQSYCNALCDELALLSKQQMRTLFPEAHLISERFFGLPKSIIAVRSGEENDCRVQ